MQKDSQILIVGHDDVIERSLTQYFCDNGYLAVCSASAQKLEASCQEAVQEFFKKQTFDYVFLGSTRSGGIEANQKFRAEFMYHNLMSAGHVIHAAYQAQVKKLLFFGSSCVYPKDATQPLKEGSLLTGPMEATSEPYSVAKLAGIKLCQAYRRQYGFNAVVAVPATVYGPGMDADLSTAHVLGALITKFIRAVREGQNEVVLWGTGSPRREFLFADDFVRACARVMETHEEEALVNVGCGFDISIKELAEIVAEVTGFSGRIVFDKTKPDGAPRKLLDNSRLTKLGWRPQVDLKEGVARTVSWYKEHFIT